MENILTLDLMKNLTVNEIARLYQLGYRIEGLVDPVVNFGKVTVSTGYNNSVMSIVLNTNDGIKLPYPATDGAFNLVWYNSSDYSDPSDDPFTEIVRCTSRSSDTLTISRGEEGTAASYKNLLGKTYKMILSPTKKTITDIQTDAQSRINTHSALTTGIHGTTGTVVGTSDAQILTNKTITDTSNYVNATMLKSLTTTIDVSTAAAPSPGQVLTATSSTAATWQIPTDTTKVSKTGDTMTGVLNLPSDGLIVGTNQLIISVGNVGIGATEPKYRGDVSGSFRVGGPSQVGASSGYGIEFHPGTGTNQIYAYNRNTISPLNLSLQEAGGNLFIYGNVGIGTASPNQKLEIGSNSGLGFSGSSPSLNSADKKLYSPADGDLEWMTNTGAGQAGFAISHQGSKLIYLSVKGDSYFNSGGRVGIGTISPTAKLHIGGTPGVDGIKFPDGTTQTTAAGIGSLVRTQFPAPTTNNFVNEANIDDGNLTNTTYFTGQTGTLLYDLTAVKFIGIFCYKISSYQPLAGSETFDFQVSEDNATWTTIWSSGYINNTTVTATNLMWYGFARYIRFYRTGNNGGGTSTIYECVLFT